MKSTETEFKYPVFGFTPDAGIWSFRDKSELATCGPDTLRDSMQDGMELIDSAGGRWRVLSIRRVGGVGLSLGLSCFFAGVSRIEQDLERQPAMSLEEVKARVQACIEASPDDWTWPDLPLGTLLDQVSNIQEIAQLETLLGPDHFRSY